MSQNFYSPKSSILYKLLLFLGKRQVYLMHLYEVSTGNEMRSYFKL